MKLNESPPLAPAKPPLRWFKVKLAIGIAGYVNADYHVVSDSLLRFYNTQSDHQQVAAYNISSVLSVEELDGEDNSRVVIRFDRPEQVPEVRKAS